MNSQVEALLPQVAKALKPEPPLGGNVRVDLGPDGAVWISKNNFITYPSTQGTADATIHLSLDTLNNLRQGGDVAIAMLTGNLTIDGDVDLARRFGTILQTALAPPA